MLVFTLLLVHVPKYSVAQALSTRIYSVAEGLTNQVVMAIRQDPTGYLYLLTEHGVFVYDGKSFANLGRQQGLPSGGFVQNIVFDAQGRVILGYPHEIFVSDTATSPRHSPTTLKFHAIVDVDEPHESDGIYGMAVRGNEVVFKYGGHLELLSLENVRAGSLKRHLFDNALDRFPDVVAVLGHESVLWVAYKDGSVRTEQNGVVTTVLSPGGLGGEAIQDWSFDRHGRVYAVSAHHLVAFEGNRVRSVEALPMAVQEDGETYYGRTNWIASDGSGTLVIWAGYKLYQHRPGKNWQIIKLAPGRSHGASTGFVDSSGALWLGSDGEEGVRRVVGWGMWQSFDDADALAGAGDLWSLLSFGKDRVLALADHGVFILGGEGKVQKIDGQDSYVGKIDAKGHIWFSSEKKGVGRLTLDPADNVVEQLWFDIKRVNDMGIQRIPGKEETLWIATAAGLYHLPADVRRRQTPEKIVSGEFQMPAKISSIAFGGQGAVWFLADGKLFCRDPGGRIVAVENRWAIRNFLPFSLLFRTDGELWVGGVGGGIFRVFVDGSRVRKIVHVNVPDILSDSVSSLALDEQKRVWVGTDRGVSVYDGARWVSANDNDGLLWNDLNQNGLTSTPDGTIWISTSRGVSHLLKPDLLFAPRDLRPVFSDVRLGDKALPERAVPYGKQPLTVRFGLLNFSAQENVQFRYRLEGVDADWAYTTTGEVRYASVPSGHHKLVLQAIDTLRHEVSPPVSVLIRMKRPWWVAWPLLVLYVAVVVTSIYAFVRARTRRLLRRQHELEQIVAERTFEMQRAQRALEEQARQDGLTKLLNRRTIEASILRVLEGCQPGASTNVVTVALIDVDHFKSINDRFGHMVGDEVLIEIGARFLQMRRPGELFGRFGGEEFLVAVEGADEEASRRVCDIAVEITEAPFRTRLGAMSVTISAGVAQCRTGESLDELIERADRALYRAKADGRDRIVFSGKDLENEAYRG